MRFTEQSGMHFSYWFSFIEILRGETPKSATATALEDDDFNPIYLIPNYLTKLLHQIIFHELNTCQMW